MDTTNEDGSGAVASLEPEVARLVDFDAGETFPPVLLFLKRPFKMFGNEYRTLALRVPTGADVDRFLKGDDAEAEMRALSIELSGLPGEVFDRMASGDRSAVWDRIGRMLGNKDLD